jgi:hypothetical protein
MTVTRVTTEEYDVNLDIWRQVAQVEGAPRIIAAALRAQADELDPRQAPPVDPEQAARERVRVRPIDGMPKL